MGLQNLDRRFKSDYHLLAYRAAYIFAGVAELADALDLGSSVFGRVGSSPTTRIANHILTICRFSSVGRASVL